MKETNPSPRRLSGQKAFLIAAAAVSVLAVGAIVLWPGHGPDNNAAGADSQLTLKDIPFNGERAYDYLKQLCAIGPRPAVRPAWRPSRNSWPSHFTKLGGKVEFQRFRIPETRPGSRGHRAHRQHDRPLAPAVQEADPLGRALRHAPLSAGRPRERATASSSAPTTTPRAWPCSWNWPTRYPSWN